MVIRVAGEYDVHAVRRQAGFGLRAEYCGEIAHAFIFCTLGDGGGEYLGHFRRDHFSIGANLFGKQHRHETAARAHVGDGHTCLGPGGDNDVAAARVDFTAFALKTRQPFAGRGVVKALVDAGVGARRCGDKLCGAQHRPAKQGSQRDTRYDSIWIHREPPDYMREDTHVRAAPHGGQTRAFRSAIRKLPVRPAAIGGRLVACVHAVVAHHTGDADAVVGKHFAASLRLRYAMAFDIAPGLHCRLVAPERDRHKFAGCGDTFKTLDGDKSIELFQRGLQ